MANEIEKRTAKLGRGGMERGDSDMAQMQQVSNHLQTINAERKRNLDVEKATMGAEQGSNEILNQAGAMVAEAGTGGAVSQVAQMNPQTQAVLGKYGLGTKRTQGHDVQIKPGNITIHNNYNTTTTNNIVGGGGGPTQGRAISFKPAADPQQMRFKTWINNVFASQRERTAARTREFEKRESSLSKQAGKMLKRLEDLGRTVATNLNPRTLGTTLGGQLKILLFLFGSYFLTKNIGTVVTWIKKGARFLDNIVAYFGIGDRGKQMIARGEGLRGDLIRFLGGDPRDQKKSVLSVLTEVFQDLKEYLKMRFEHAMEERGVALKSVKFPKLDFSDVTEKSFGDNWLMKLLGKGFSGVVNSFGHILSTTFNGLGTYMKDVFTAIINPKAGLQAVAETKIKDEGINGSAAASSRSGETSMFEHINGFGSDTMAGDYALEKKGKDGKRNYSLLANAVGPDGKLNGSAGSTISQGRDILGALNDAKDYGRIDTARLYSGLVRLRDTAQENGKVIIDKEFVDRMFGSDQSEKMMKSGALKKVKMKYVVDDVTSEENYLQDKYIDEKVSPIADTANIATNIASIAIPGTGALKAAKGASALAKAGKVGWSGLKGAVKGGFLGSFTAGAVNSIAEMIGEDGKILRLVPVDDPRPAAEIDGKTSEPVEYYEASHEAITNLMNSYDPQKTGKLSTVLGNVEKHLVDYGGGKDRVNMNWKLRGEKSGYFEDQEQYSDVHTLAKDEIMLDNMIEAHRQKEQRFLDESHLGAIERNSKALLNTGIDYANKGIDWAGNKANDMTQGLKRRILSAGSTSTTGATYAYEGKAPENPARTDLEFNSEAAADTLRRNAAGGPGGGCAKAVRVAIASGFGRPGDDIRGMVEGGLHIKEAKQYASLLPEIGFAPLDWNSYKRPKTGDVLVEPSAPGGSKEGHIAMYDGEKWISDFVQRDMWGGQGYREQKKGVIFRHTSQLEDTDRIAAGVQGSEAFQEDNISVSTIYSSRGKELAPSVQPSDTSQPTSSSPTIESSRAQQPTAATPVGNREISSATRMDPNIETNLNAKLAIDYLMKEQELTKSQAAGIVGNLWAESKLNPSVRAMDTNHRYSYGIAQFNNKAYTEGSNSLFRYAERNGKPWDDLQTQLEYLAQTPQGRAAIEKIRGVQSAKEASFIWGRDFEVFGPGRAYADPNSAEHRKRAGFASQMEGIVCEATPYGSQGYTNPTEAVYGGGKDMGVDMSRFHIPHIGGGKDIAPAKTAEEKANDTIDTLYTKRGFDALGKNKQAFATNWKSMTAGDRNAFISARNFWYANDWPEEFKKKYFEHATFDEFYKMFMGLSPEMQKSYIQEKKDQLRAYKATDLDYLEKKYGKANFSKYFGYELGLIGEDREATQQRLYQFEGGKYHAAYYNRGYQAALQAYGDEVFPLLKQQEELKDQIKKLKREENPDERYIKELEKQLNDTNAQLDEYQQKAKRAAEASTQGGKFMTRNFARNLRQEDAASEMLKTQKGINDKASATISSIEKKRSTEIFNARAMGKTQEEINAINEKYAALRKKAEDSLAKELEEFQKLLNQKMDKINSGTALTALINSVALANSKGDKEAVKRLVEKYASDHKVNRKELIARIGMSVEEIYGIMGEKKEDYTKEVKKVGDRVSKGDLTGGLKDGSGKTGLLYDVAGKDREVGEKIKSWLSDMFNWNPKEGYGNVMRTEDGNERVVWNYPNGKTTTIAQRIAGGSKWEVVSPWFNERIVKANEGNLPTNKYGHALIPTRSFAVGGFTPDAPSDTPFEAELHGGELVLPKVFNVEHPELAAGLNDFITTSCWGTNPVNVKQEGGYRDNNVPDFIKKAEEIISGRKSPTLEDGFTNSTFKKGIEIMVNSMLQCAKVNTEGQKAICNAVGSVGNNAPRNNYKPKVRDKTHYPREF